MRTAAALAVAAPLTLVTAAHAYDVWPGYDYAFSKPNGADINLPQNQDRITPGVWITRANQQGIFNFAQELGYGAGSPAGTLWAYGTTADIGSLTFQVWRDAVAANPPSSVGRNMVLYLTAQDIYIDIRFTSWTAGALGGGFSYVRGVQIPAPPVLALFPAGVLVVIRRRR